MDSNKEDDMSFDVFAQEFENWQKAKGDLLEYLAETYLYHLSTEDKSNPVLICCILEQAYWWSIKEGSIDPETSFISFTSDIFHHVNFLQRYKTNVAEIVNDFETFKRSVPIFGTVILNRTLSRVLLVKNTYQNWSFPVGKIMKGENEIDCAIRETLEETGLNMHDRIDMLDYFVCNYNGKKCKVFVIRDTEGSTPKSCCPYEIIDVCWFAISALPLFIGDELYADKRMNVGSKRFRRTIPFMQQLIKWIESERIREKCIREQEIREMKRLGLPLEFQ